MNHNRSDAVNEGLLAELRRHERDYPSLVHGSLCGQAADEIERLRAVPSPGTVGVRTALEQIAEVASYAAKKIDEVDAAYVSQKTAGVLNNARERFLLIVRTSKAALSPAGKTGGGM